MLLLVMVAFEITYRAFLRDTGGALPIWLQQRVRRQKTARDVQYDAVPEILYFPRIFAWYRVQ